MKNIRIYSASRASVPERTKMWKSLREQGWNIISTWIDESGPGETKSMEELWSRIEQEVQSCDVLILYYEPNDLPLKGAFIEAGMALAFKKPVIVWGVGNIGSWTNHPSVFCSQTKKGVLQLINDFARSTSACEGKPKGGA